MQQGSRFQKQGPHENTKTPCYDACDDTVLMASYCNKWKVSVNPDTTKILLFAMRKYLKATRVKYNKQS